jgi:hypothetical protein
LRGADIDSHHKKDDDTDTAAVDVAFKLLGGVIRAAAETEESKTNLLRIYKSDEIQEI